MTSLKDKRRAFVRAENIHLGRFLNVEALAGWHRSYRCECGFACNDPGTIFDHVCSDKAVES